jgi:lipopolysaccharide transport system ATP-binding protein
MRVRLAFAVAAHLEPDILVVDEVLAVGDAEFQKKAIGKMKDISDNDGRTVLFVSHNMAAVKSLCTRGIVLENGTSTFKGTAEESVDFYLSNNSNVGSSNFFNEKLNENGIALKYAKINSLNSKNIIDVETGFEIEIEFENNNIDKTITASIVCYSQEEIRLFELPCFLFDNKNSKKGTFKITTLIPPYLLNSGIYSFKFVIGESQKYVLYLKDNILNVEIEDTSFNKGSNLNKPQGLLRPKINWDVQVD